MGIAEVHLLHMFHQHDDTVVLGVNQSQRQATLIAHVVGQGHHAIEFENGCETDVDALALHAVARIVLRKSHRIL